MSILIRSRLPSIGNRSPFMQYQLPGDDGEGSRIRDISGRNNHFNSAEVTGFSAEFWESAGLASFNVNASTPLTDYAICGANYISDTAARDHRFPWGMAEPGGSRMPSILVKVRYTPIRELNGNSDFMSMKSGDGATTPTAMGVALTGTRGVGVSAFSPRHMFDWHVNPTATTATFSGDTWLSAATDEMNETGGSLPMGVERNIIILVDRGATTGGANGELTVWVNSLVALNSETLDVKFASEADPAANAASEGWIFGIGGRGPRLEDTSRALPFRMRDCQLYMTYKDITDAAGLLTAADALGVNEYLTRDDWG